MTSKQRLSASVDGELLHVAQTAVDNGRATSISAWVNDALRLKADHDRRMDALDSFLATYEAEHGVITEAEIDQAVRRAKSRATVVRSTSDEGVLSSSNKAGRATSKKTTKSQSGVA